MEDWVRAAGGTLGRQGLTGLDDGRARLGHKATGAAPVTDTHREECGWEGADGGAGGLTSALDRIHDVEGPPLCAASQFLRVPPRSQQEGVAAPFSPLFPHPKVAPSTCPAAASD